MSDYPMLISNKLHSFRNFRVQKYDLFRWCNFFTYDIAKEKHLDCLRGSIMTHLRKFVSSVPEYRRTSRGNFKHKLEDILMLVILGRLSKCIFWLKNEKNSDLMYL